MGDIHGMRKSITLAELAEQSGGNYDTFYRKAKRKFPETEWSKDAELSTDQIAVLSGNMSGNMSGSIARRKKNIRTTKPTTVNQPGAAARTSAPPARQKFKLPKLPKLGLSEFLAIAIYGHTGLVWYEISTIFGTPGILAGIVVFALKHAALVICRSGKWPDYITDVFGVAFLLDALAVWAHYTAFTDAMPAHFKDQVGPSGTFWAALILGLVVAAGAFISLYFTEKTATK